MPSTWPSGTAVLSRAGSSTLITAPKQFTSWVFGEKIRSAGLLPSFGTVGDGLDNAMMESFWSSMQIELLNRKKWKTRVELANAIFDYIEIFHNRQRRPLSARLSHPHRVRTTLRKRTHPRCQLATADGAQTVGQVNLSPDRAADPPPGAINLSFPDSGLGPGTGGRSPVLHQPCRSSPRAAAGSAGRPKNWPARRPAPGGPAKACAIDIHSAATAPSADTSVSPG
jgi:hypothetical protein